MFNDNKYTKVYYRIIENSRGRINEGYVERHHIIPRSCGGTDDISNLVSLTGREHFICHWLLTKMVTDSTHIRNMHYAFKLMSKHGKTNRLRNIARRFGADRSEETRQKISQTMKEQYASGARKPAAGMKGKKMPADAKYKISAALKNKPKSPEHQQKCREANLGRKWYNNGKESRMFFPGFEPHEFVLGRKTINE